MPATDRPEVAARRERLRAWIREKFNGSRKAFLEDAASRGTPLDPTEVSNLQSGGKSFGEVKAQMVELAANMPPGYLVQPQSQTVGLDAEIVRAAIILARKSFKLAHDEELVIERDAELFAQALRAALAKRQMMGVKSGNGSRSGDGKTGSTSSTSGASQDGAETGPKVGRKRRTS